MRRSPRIAYRWHRDVKNLYLNILIFIRSEMESQLQNQLYVFADIHTQIVAALSPLRSSHIADYTIACHAEY